MRDCSVDLALSGSGEFALNPATPPTPITLAFGQSTNVLVDYTPVDVGADIGTGTVTSNDPDAGTVAVALTGSGLGAPDLAATPTPLAFGTVKLAQTVTRTVTLSNIGDADLTISELPRTGSGDFALNPAAPTPPLTIVPGASVNVPVDYTPTVATNVSAVIWVVSNDPDTDILPVRIGILKQVLRGVHPSPSPLSWGQTPPVWPEKPPV